MGNHHPLPCHLLLCGDVESNPGPEQRRTNRETGTWLKDQAAQNLTMRENLEQANVYFGGFSGDHRSFESWKKDFLQKQRKMKKEAQERLMGHVGGTGKYNGTPPSDYCPFVERFRFISENFLCEKCNDSFVNEANVMIHLRSAYMSVFFPLWLWSREFSTSLVASNGQEFLERHVDS